MTVGLYDQSGAQVGSVDLPADCWPDLPEVLVQESAKRVFVLTQCEDEPGRDYVEVATVIWVGSVQVTP